MGVEVGKIVMYINAYVSVCVCCVHLCALLRLFGLVRVYKL